MEQYISLASISITLTQVGYSAIKAQADITKTPFDTIAPTVTLFPYRGVQEGNADRNLVGNITPSQ